MSAISEPCLSFNEVSAYQRDGCLIYRLELRPALVTIIKSSQF
jgi:hypothetical protein